MDWWKEFPGWLITTLLAFSAFALLVWQEIRRRLLLPRAAWEGSWVYKPLATSDRDRHFALTNSGDVQALGVMVLAYNCRIPGPNPGKLIGLAELMTPKTIPLASVNDDSYLVISWRSPHHRARTLMTWLPVEQNTELAAIHWEQRTWPWYKTAWARIRHPHAAGPGTALDAMLPRSPRQVQRMHKKVAGRLESKQK